MQATDDLPRVVVTSYDMLHRLTCEPCKRSDMNACTGRQVTCYFALAFAWVGTVICRANPRAQAWQRQHCLAVKLLSAWQGMRSVQYAHHDT